MCYAQYEVESVFGRCMTCDSRMWSCLQPGLPVRVPYLDYQGVVSLAVLCADRSSGRLARDSRVWSCLWPGLPVRAAHLDQQGTGASVQAPVCRLRQLQAETDCRPNQR